MSELAHMQVSDLASVDGLKLLAQVDGSGQKVLDWAAENQAHVERLLQENGALLVRGLSIPSSRQFGRLLETLFGEPLIEYAYRSTPRTELRGHVYTATEYHHDQTIPQHNENAYSNRWPMRIGFLCTNPPEGGGETPISASAEIRARLPKEIVAEFEAKGVKYVRNYSQIDLPWSEVFQTEDREAVEAYCTENRITCEWLEDDALRTTQVNPAVARHPITGEVLWFNQAHLFHVTNLDEEVRESMLAIMPEDRLPKNTYFGDGTPIDPDYLTVIRDFYQQTRIVFPWQRHDLMLLDNMSFTHGRNPFVGSRQVLVGMTRAAEHSPQAIQAIHH